jgi:hypothetical protein
LKGLFVPEFKANKFFPTSSLLVLTTDCDLRSLLNLLVDNNEDEDNDELVVTGKPKMEVILLFGVTFVNGLNVFDREVVDVWLTVVTALLFAPVFEPNIELFKVELNPGAVLFCPNENSPDFSSVGFVN